MTVDWIDPPAATARLHVPAPGSPFRPTAVLQPDAPLRRGARSTPVLAGILTAFFLAAVFLGNDRSQGTALVVLEAIAMLAAALLVIVAADRYRGGPIHGSAVLMSLVALTAVVGLSVAWSYLPSASWIEFNRYLAYTATLGAGIAAARLWGGRFEIPLFAIMAAAVICVVAALAGKVAPVPFDPDQVFARIQEPFGYWNAVAIAGVFAMMPSLWLAARRDGKPVVNALGLPMLGLSLVAVTFAFSRGAILALVLILVVWFAVVPLRLRSAAALGTTVLLSAPALWFALGQSGLSSSSSSLATRANAGVALWLTLVVLVGLLFGAGVLLNRFSAGRRIAPDLRRKLGIAAIATTAVLLVGAAGVALFSGKGPGHNISSTWKSLLSTKSTPPTNDSDRLITASNSRAQYWSQATNVFELEKLRGTGAGGFEAASKRFRREYKGANHAHGQIPQALSDLGIVGAVLTAIAGILWLGAVVRNLGFTLWRRTAVPPDDHFADIKIGHNGGRWTRERVALVALALVPIAFGMQAALDWTWYIPGVAIPAIFCAGWVVGRGPVCANDDFRADRLDQAWDRDAGHAQPLAPPDPAEPSSANREGLARLAVTAAILAAAGIGVWSAVQPVRAQNAADAAVRLAEQHKIPEAYAKALQARNIDPTAVEPLYALSKVFLANGNAKLGELPLEEAVHVQPANPETWNTLGVYQTNVLNESLKARMVLAKAVSLDPYDRAITDNFILANHNARFSPPPNSAAAAPSASEQTQDKPKPRRSRSGNKK